MRNPYLYYIPNYYRRPNYQIPNYYPPEKPSKEYPYSCVIEEKYCDYFDLGDTAPNFTLDAIIDNEKTKVSLSDYLGQWVLLFFYGSNFTFV